MKKLILTAIVALSLLGCKTTSTIKTESKAETKQEVKAKEVIDNKTAFDIKTVATENKDFEIERIEEIYSQPDTAGKIHLTKSVKTKIVNKGKSVVETQNNTTVAEVSKKQIKAIEQAKTEQKSTDKVSKMTVGDYVLICILALFAVLAIIYFKFM